MLGSPVQVRSEAPLLNQSGLDFVVGVELVFVDLPISGLVAFPGEQIKWIEKMANKIGINVKQA